jgi:hypothetical protein
MATTPDRNPIAAATEVVREARARWQQARVIGDEVGIEIARADLEEAMRPLDGVPDDFVRIELRGCFQRRRDLPAAGKSTGTVLPFGLERKSKASR